MKKMNVMEVCGTHTHAIARTGAGKILAGKINFISGPGCPVCVSAQSDIDNMISLALKPGVIITTFGDMLRVPGTELSLRDAGSKGADIRVLYSPADALKTAAENPDKKVVFLAVGFETTSPLIAACVLKAKELKINNFYIYCCLKIINPAIKIILEEENEIDAFLLPGNVSVITGYKAFDFIPKIYKKPAVAGGFSAREILKAAEMLLNKEIKKGAQNAYVWATAKGNEDAQKTVKKVFTVADGNWRGFGLIKKSALKLKKEYEKFDAKKVFRVENRIEPQTKCRCGLILKGKIKPPQCPYFAKACTPLKPLGPCMVSAEGACAAAFNNKTR